MAQKEKLLYIAQEAETASAFLDALLNELPKLKTHNLLIKLSNAVPIPTEVLLKFQQLAILHKKNKKSFVVVYADANFSELPDDFQIVPTLQEGEDTIEMEEIERDLGF